MSILRNLPTFTRKGYANKATAQKIARQLAKKYKATTTIKEASIIKYEEFHVWQIIRIDFKNGTWARFVVLADESLAFVRTNTCSEGGGFPRLQGCKTAADLIAKLQKI